MKICANWYALFSQKEVPTSSIFLHQVHCEKNFSVCECGVSVSKIEKSNHDLEFHCAIECKHCNISMEAFIYQFHECEKIPRICKFCEGHFPVDMHADHIFQCGSRTELCKKC